MARWMLNLPVDVGTSSTPRFLRIAEAVAGEVRRGRLRPGARLPGTRTLARTLRVNRDTVVAAYGQLQAEGWVEVLPKRGAYVAASTPDVALPAARARRRGLPP